MSREFFGTDGHRAAVGQGLITPEGAFSAGLAVGAAAMEDGRENVPIAWDTRESSGWMQTALSAGVTAAGANAVRIGVVPTPGLAYITGITESAAYGIMTTASHNLYTDNGIKVLAGDGGKLIEAAQDDINGRIQQTLPAHNAGQRFDGSRLAVKYEHFLVAQGQTDDPAHSVFRGLKMVVDTANGAASGLARNVFERLGASVIPIFDKPNGVNINEACGATDTASLQECVVNLNADVGLAFDGDADRLQMVDHHGRLLDGDHIMYALAMTDPQPHKGVVGTVMSNKGFENALAQNNIKLDRRDVGDRFVLQGLRETQWRLGGEQSGHIILPDYLCTGDGMLAAIHTIKQVYGSGRTLADLRDEVKLFPQRTVNINVTDKSVLHGDLAQKLIEEHNEQLGDSGRLLVRPSGTEQKIRVMVEADDAHDRAPRIASQLSEVFASAS